MLHFSTNDFRAKSASVVENAVSQASYQMFIKGQKVLQKSFLSYQMFQMCAHSKDAK